MVWELMTVNIEKELFLNDTEDIARCTSCKNIKMSNPVSISAFLNQETKEGKEITPPHTFFFITKKPPRHI